MDRRLPDDDVGHGDTHYVSQVSEVEVQSIQGRHRIAGVRLSALNGRGQPLDGRLKR